MVPKSGRMSCCLRRWMYSSRAAVTASFLVRWRPSFWASVIKRSSMARWVSMGLALHLFYTSWCLSSSAFQGEKPRHPKPEDGAPVRGKPAKRNSAAKKRRRGDGAPPRMNNAQADGKLPSCSGFDGRKSRRARSIRARRMAEPGLAIACTAVRVWRDVENDVVRMRRVAGKQACGARNCRLRGGGGHMIESEQISHAPHDVVVRAGSVSAY